MASRWMQAKLYKMKRAKLFTPHDTKNRAGHTMEGSNALTSEVATLREGYTGAVTVGSEGRKVEPMGKTQRKYDGRTFGNGVRRIGSSADYYNLWNCSDRLVRNGEVIV